MKICKDNRVIEVTEKAFAVIYQTLGYLEYVETADPEEEKPAKAKRGK